MQKDAFHDWGIEREQSFFYVLRNTYNIDNFDIVKLMLDRASRCRQKKLATYQNKQLRISSLGTNPQFSGNIVAGNFQTHILKTTKSKLNIVISIQEERTVRQSSKKCLFGCNKDDPSRTDAANIGISTFLGASRGRWEPSTSQGEWPSLHSTTVCICSLTAIGWIHRTYTSHRHPKEHNLTSNLKWIRRESWMSVSRLIKFKNNNGSRKTLERFWGCPQRLFEGSRNSFGGLPQRVLGSPCSGFQR